MARNSEILLGDQAWGVGTKADQLDPLLGGQFGWATNPNEWISAQAYIPRNLIPIVLEVPRFFTLMQNREKWTAAWKLMWEKHARTIEGLKAGLTVDVGDHAFGGGGELFQEYLDVKRERSTLTLGMVDKFGNVFQTFLEKCIMYGMMHPETKTPLTATLEGETPPDNLADWYAGTVAFIEPTPNGRHCRRCWISTNIWPQNNGPVEGKMDKTSALAIKDLSIDFSSLTFIGDGTQALGQQLLTNINMTNANPQRREAFIKEIAADVKAVEKGYQESVENIAPTAVPGL